MGNTVIELKNSDRDFLQSKVRKRNIPKWEYHRYMIILMLDEKLSFRYIADKLLIYTTTVNIWKKRYLAGGLDGLKDRPRSGRPREIKPETEAKILRIVTEKKPKGKTHWSTRDVAKATGIPQSTISVILRRNNLKPHLHGTFMVSNDPEFEKKASDIIGLYLNPPHNAIVLSVDEKSQMQALDRLQPNLPLKQHLIEKSTFEYKRNGTACLFAALNIKTGKVSGQCSTTHNRYDFLDFLNNLAKQYRGRDVHVILDNFRTHKTKEVKDWLEKHPSWQFHFTPTYSSWINQIEIWFSIISRQCIRRGIFHSQRQLINSVMKFIKQYKGLATI